MAVVTGFTVELDILETSSERAFLTRWGVCRPAEPQNKPRSPARSFPGCPSIALCTPCRRPSITSPVLLQWRSETTGVNCVDICLRESGKVDPITLVKTSTQWLMMWKGIIWITNDMIYRSCSSWDTTKICQVCNYSGLNEIKWSKHCLNSVAPDLEHVRFVDEAHERQESSVRPAVDRHTTQVDELVFVSCVVQTLHLVLDLHLALFLGRDKKHSRGAEAGTESQKSLKHTTLSFTAPSNFIPRWQEPRPSMTSTA